MEKKNESPANNSSPAEAVEGTSQGTSKKKLSERKSTSNSVHLGHPKVTNKGKSSEGNNSANQGSDGHNQGSDRPSNPQKKQFGEKTDLSKHQGRDHKSPSKSVGEVTQNKVSSEGNNSANQGSDGHNQGSDRPSNPQKKQFGEKTDLSKHQGRDHKSPNQGGDGHNQGSDRPSNPQKKQFGEKTDLSKHQGRDHKSPSKSVGEVTQNKVSSEGNNSANQGSDGHNQGSDRPSNPQKKQFGEKTDLSKHQGRDHKSPSKSVGGSAQSNVTPKKTSGNESTSRK